MLFVLPVAVMVGSSGLLIWGTLASALVLKGSDQVLRYSMTSRAVELLYLPLPHSVKLRAKWFYDTVIWRLGDGWPVVTALISGHLSACSDTPHQLGCTVSRCAWFIAVSVAEGITSLL